MKLFIAVSARTDLVEIQLFGVKTWGRGQADKYRDLIRDRMKVLARGEVSGTLADNIAPGLRRQVVGSHAIWFRLDGERLVVLRVLHQSRDAGRWVE